MRLIVVGCEYAGKTTLVNRLREWGQSVGFHFHMDDHFQIPDHQNLSREEQEKMLALGPVVKERFQRFQIYYHVPILHKYDHVLITGLHIEEAVYGPRYYYEKAPMDYFRLVEKEFPPDTVLVLLEASKAVLLDRMAKDPHPFSLVGKKEIDGVCQEFQQQFQQSWVRRKVRVDTTELSPEEVMARVLELVRPHLGEKDLLRLLHHRMDEVGK